MEPTNQLTTEQVQTRLARIEQLLNSDPANARSEAMELLEAVPGQLMATLYLGIAYRLLRQPGEAVAVLRPLGDRMPNMPMPHLQLGLAAREAGDNVEAEKALRSAVQARPDFAEGWLSLADLLTATGNTAAADEAFTMYVRHSGADQVLGAAATALRENRTADAEAALRARLQSQPNDVGALCMLADVGARHARYDDAAKLLERCLELAPGYHAARQNYAMVLMRLNRMDEALAEVERLLGSEPDNASFLRLKAGMLMRAADYEGAIAIYESLLAAEPDQPALWASMGHALRTLGRRDECIAAYRKAFELAPGYGEGAWNLANLKNVGITDTELATMRAQLDGQIGDDDRAHFQFAIGKALEDRGEYADSFRHYTEGNRLRHAAAPYDPDELSRHVAHCKELFTPEFLAERADWGAPDADPIFIVGLPRAGSTLVEQILASHSAVEGTAELPHLLGAALSLSDRKGEPVERVAGTLDAAECRALGEAYLERARPQRVLGTPFYTDKMPNNFMHVGLIRLILPNARIVDVRRHPMACGLSLYKQLFARGQHFSYSLEDLGRFYCDYVELMTHFETVAPGRVHRIHYESLVTDTESEVRALLGYCGLDFEAACLNAHLNPRPVATVSSEQVRAPITSAGLDHWKHFEPWLEPLKAALGPVLADYPDPAGRS